ncbi:metal-dependent hydrolase [Selenomonas ruminantium]|uniref:Inner membrane protein n=1 Tax=Selenomonas ruminantium TaxID=971 RepID=A0A1H0USF3_SELRU|nr:metal-dependent hydrolase [Selenomonas ruminantium]SDP69013.1 inner membrane protein [Selenomonas ruminantium]
MKWVNHEIVTGVIVYGATADPLATVFSMAGAIFPDKVEGRPGANYWSWRAKHRGWSHWPVIYIAIYALMQLGFLPQGAEAERGVSFICIGALLHIAEDAVCGKVPFLFPWQKVGIKLFKVGSVTEYLFAMALVIITYIIHAQTMIK